MQQHSGSVSEGLLGPSRQGPAELFSSMGHGATETAVQKVCWSSPSAQSCLMLNFSLLGGFSCANF